MNTENQIIEWKEELKRLSIFVPPQAYHNQYLIQALVDCNLNSLRILKCRRKRRRK